MQRKYSTLKFEYIFAMYYHYWNDVSPALNIQTANAENIRLNSP